jgi:hypothetical protein
MSRIARLLAATFVLVALTSAPAMAGPVKGCNDYEFCIYDVDNPTPKDMVARMKSCTWHDVRGKNLQSYVNNQTRGTRARFYDHTRTILLSHSKPAFSRGTIAFSVGLNTAYVRPC